MENRADINKENSDDETLTFYASHSGNENMLKYLMELGADINKKKKKKKN